MGAKIEKAKSILNVVKEVGDAVMDAVDKIDKSTSKLRKEENASYSVERCDDKGNKITLCSIHDSDGSWHYRKTIETEDGRTVIQHFDSMPTQEDVDGMKG